MGPRRKGRILAVQALYSYEMQGGVPIEGLATFPWDEENEEDLKGAKQFAILLLGGTIEHLLEIDRWIQEHLEHWEIKRLAKVDLSILRMSVYCLLHQKEIPASVVIDEAVDLSKEFCSEDSYRFVNGVLDAIYKAITSKGLDSP